ncbi:hypothetical protein [Ruegeria faecimaris]|uniref:hypothetical protein n=1 Tax=Ruegeria faecimaris TaxID=686389 RepID=UPI0024917AC1|nr:hypothetical protein [Ruegeria faecimaris]
MKGISKFLSGEHGAITVDWVVLTAALVGLGLVTVFNLTGGVQHVDTETGNALRGVEVYSANQEQASESD